MILQSSVGTVIAIAIAIAMEEYDTILSPWITYVVDDRATACELCTELQNLGIVTLWNSLYFVCELRENVMELLQRYRRDRRILLNFMLSGSLIKKVIMPPGAVSLDDVDLDQVSVDYVLSCAKKGI